MALRRLINSRVLPWVVLADLLRFECFQVSSNFGLIGKNGFLWQITFWRFCARLGKLPLRSLFHWNDVCGLHFVRRDVEVSLGSLRRG